MVRTELSRYKKAKIRKGLSPNGGELVGWYKLPLLGVCTLTSGHHKRLGSCLLSHLPQVKMTVCCFCSCEYPSLPSLLAPTTLWLKYS